MEIPLAAIRSQLAPFGVNVDDHQGRQIALYVKTLLFWNQRINLTAVTDPHEILRRHFGESMFGAQFLEGSGGTIFDVGSGAGFPGLPLKILRPSLHVKLIEPVTKKAAFLSEIARLLELSHVEVLRRRIEDMDEASAADCIVARAVGDLSGLLSWAGRAANVGAQTLLWLGREDAISASRIAGWSWADPAPIPLSRNRVVLSGRKMDLRKSGET
ncbi:MAG: 16S rRNA (guanine(527)-N(7))-methyltransferase RsmG [Candidatus Acidiferrales bacterium]